MKKIRAIAFALLLCACLGACAFGVGRPVETGPYIDPLGKPEIVIDANSVTKEECFDANGKLIGYVQYTSGTNCGVSGTVLIEFLDLNGKVLNTYSPKLAGCTLASGQFGSFGHGEYELTDIWESDYKKNAVTSNEYKLVPYSGGKLYAYLENRAGRTTRCDLYGRYGRIVAQLKPADPQNQLYIDNIHLYEDEHYEDHFLVVEGYVEGDTRYGTRHIYYTMSGKLLADFALTSVPAPNSHMVNILSIDCTDKDGIVQKTYRVSADGILLRCEPSGGCGV